MKNDVSKPNESTTIKALIDIRMNRKEALLEVLSFSPKMENALGVLKSFPYEHDSSLVTLSANHIKMVLTKFLNGDTAASEIEDWANFIEGRDDIDYENYQDYVYQLANPYLEGNLTKESAIRMLNAM